MFMKTIAPGSSAVFYSVLLAFVPFGPVIAEDAEATADAAEQHYDIKVTSLTEALIEFSSQSDIVVVVSPAVAEGRSASSVKGDMTPDEAIDALLQGTGLEYSRDDNGVTIREPGQVDAKSIEGAEPVGEPIAMLQFESGQDGISGGAGATVTSASSATTPVEFIGTVVDSRTGSNLKGALVEIVDLGQSTTTDDLGRFRFPGLPAGRHTLRISYLGYLQVDETFVLESGGSYQKTFALAGGTAMEEIVVYGSRSSRSQSLNQERMADNASSVVSADLLGNFEGTTISEALRRVPGVAFEQDELTGDGVNVTVRGLQANFNAVKLNGVELPETSGLGRTANLSNILADSVDKITISKSLLPSQDSAGTGGLIEIETKSPLDRPRRFARFSVEHGEAGKDFYDEDYFTGTVSGLFGADESLGLSLAVQYRESDRAPITLGATYDWGQFLPLGPNGNPSISNRDWLDPRTEFPFDPAAENVYQNRFITGINSTSRKQLSTTLSFEKQFAEHTNIRIDYVNSQLEDSNFQSNGNFNARSRYSLRPVEQLGGEERQALSLSGSHLGLHSYLARTGGQNDTDVLSLNGNSRVGKWEFDYTLAHTKGELDGGNLVSMSFWNLFATFANPLPSLLLPESVDPVEGVALSAFPGPADGSIGIPLFNDDGWAFINGTDNYGFTQMSTTRDQGGDNSRKSFNVNAKYNIESGPLRYIKAGTSYEDSRFTSVGATDQTVYSASNFLARIDGAGITQFDNSGYMSAIGFGRGLNLLSQSAVLSFANQLPELSSGPNAFFNPPSFFSPRSEVPNEFTQEDELAAYVQAQLDFGKWEIIGGVRMSRVELDAVQIYEPLLIDEFGVPDEEFAEQFTEVAKDSATDTRWLPRILSNYRYSDNFIIRAGYFKSVARPNIGDLSEGTSIVLLLDENHGPTNSQPTLVINAGNPDLEPSLTDNFDLSFEYYYDDIGAVKLGLFYKKVENLFEAVVSVTSDSEQGLELLQGVRLPDDPRFDPANLPANLYVQKTVPTNSGFDGNIRGVEASVERQLSFLPGFWGGFGVFANFTYTESDKDVSVTWFEKPVFDNIGNIVGFESENLVLRGVAFDRQPKRSGTVALTYNKYWLDATLSYTYQSRRSDEATPLSPYTDEVDSLDLRAEYWFEGGPMQFKVFLEGSDLLSGTKDTSSNLLIGPYTTSSTYFGGRSFRIGLSSTFQ